MTSSRRQRALELAIGLLAIDSVGIVLSGGISLLGVASPLSMMVRLGLLAALLFAHYRGAVAPNASRYAYVALLFLLATQLHFLGYRVRGDGLWYYAYARSIAIDGDLSLANEYQNLAIDHFVGSHTVPATGLARNTFPVGVGLLWAPFIWLGHVGVWIHHLAGDPLLYDGFVLPYQNAVAFGSLLLGWLGLLVLDELLRKWFSPLVSFLAVTATASATFLLWYLTYQPILTHTATLLLTSVTLLRWVHLNESDGPGTPKQYAVLGFLVGASYLVRWQSATLGLLPAWTLFTRLPKAGARRGAMLAGCLGGAFLLAALPQLIAWRIIFGRILFGIPLGDDYMRWSEPFVTELLFSSRHGLLSWSPILFLALAGLVGFAARRPRIGIPLSGFFLLSTYINSAVADWWAGGTFGARRFDGCLPIFAIGLACGFAWMTKLIERRPALAVAALVGTFTLGNVLFMEQYRKGVIPVDSTVSYYGAAQGMANDVLDTVGYPFSFPANWAFAKRYDRPKTQYDLLVGQYLFHRQNNLAGRIEVGLEDPPFMGNGWSSLKPWDGRERAVRYAVGERAGVFVPTDRPETLFMRIAAAAPPGVASQFVEVFINGERLDGFRTEEAMTEWRKQVDHRFWKRLNLVELVRTEGEPGTPFLALDYLQFERPPPR